MLNKTNSLAEAQICTEFFAGEILSESSKETYAETIETYKKFCNEKFKDEVNFEGINEERLLEFLNEIGYEGKKTLEEKENLHDPKTMRLIITALKYFYKSKKNDSIYLEKTTCFEFPFTEKIELFAQIYEKNYCELGITFCQNKFGIKDYYVQEQLAAIIGSALQLSTENESYISTIAQIVLSQNLLFKGNYLKNILLADLKYLPEKCYLKNSAENIMHEKFGFPKSWKRHRENNKPTNLVFKPRMTSFMKDSENEGTDSDMLVVVPSNVETNETLEPNMTGFVRHVDPKFCAQFWLSVYLVERFHITKPEEETELSFGDNESLIDLKLFNVPNSIIQEHEAIDYGIQYESIKKVMEHADVTVGDEVHAPMISGILLCQNEGVALDELLLFGMCTTNEDLVAHIRRPYFHIPLGPMAALAGSSNTSTGWKYVMPRDIVKPEKKLKEMIFPFINNILEEGSKIDFYEASEAQKLTYKTALTLDHLRTVFLQDFRFFQKNCKKEVLNANPVFNMSVFESEDYKMFRLKQENIYGKYYDDLEKWEFR